MIVLSPQAARDLNEYVAHVSERNPTAGARISERIDEVLRKLDAREFDGPMEELETGPPAQSWPAPPLRIYYDRSGDVLHVLRIYHQARRPIARRRRGPR